MDFNSYLKMANKTLREAEAETGISYELLRKYKNKQSMSHTMGIGTGIRLSANNGQQISSSFQKFQDFMPFPTKKHSMECFHHLHSFQLSAYSVYL